MIKRMQRAGPYESGSPESGLKRQGQETVPTDNS